MRFTSLLQLVCLPSALAISSLVNLDYASYQGVELPNGVTQFLGLRYAAPPLGNLRFAAPQDPLPEHNGTQPADVPGPICVATNSTNNSTSEDCLGLSVYTPSNASCDKPLPVYFFLQGGGFNLNSNPNINGSGLVTASGMNIVVVTINYRVGPYGFLASEEVLRGGSVNNGLKDQRKALYWVQRHIWQFGGDPGHVVLGGSSAGAQSVNLHVTAYGGRNDGLFHATTTESQSFSALSTVAESQFMYNNLVIRAGCVSRSDTLACLRDLSTAELQAINFNTPFPGAQNPPAYMYGPTLDYDFISDYTYRAYALGRFLKFPALLSDDTNEGTIFAPDDTDTIGQSDTFIQDQYPTITFDQLNRINQLFPNDGLPQFNGTGRYWRQTANAYGEMRFICPGIFIGNKYADFGVQPSWNSHWDVLDPTDAADGDGVKHTVDLSAVWGPENTGAKAPASYYPNGTNAAIVPVVQAYYTSFIRTYNPNTYRLPSAPQWEAWTRSNRDRRLLFRTNATAMESVPADQQARCAYLNSIGLALRQ